MQAYSPTPREEDTKGVHRLSAGGSAGLAAGIVALVLPVAFLYLATYNPGGFFTYGRLFIETTSILALAGAVLFIVSLFLYRRSFAVLRKVDGRFVTASVLCIIGTIGFLLLLISAAIFFGTSSSLLACVHGQPRHFLSCLRSGQPFGADTALIGFWLGWVGGVGIVVGLVMAGARFRRGALYAGGTVYALLLVVLIGPFVELLVPVPGIRYLILIVPVLGVLAPAFVLSGSRSPPGAPASSG
jgi:hypothetical protein